MEQGQYCWMQATNKKKLFSMASNHHLITLPQKTTNNNPSYDDELSWEEQAFAEDAAAGSLGGCIWPPRSYSCSFCRREFRSAQALGGHMNVHRRDRARLKQQPSSPKNSNNEAAEILSNNPFTSLGSYNLLYPPPPPPVCGFACNNNKANPNSDLDVIASTSSSPSPNSNPLLLAPPSSSSSVNKGPICNSSSIVHNKTYPLSLYSCESSWSTLGEDHHHRLCSNKFYPEATTANCELFNSHPRPLSSNIVAKKKFYPESDDLEKASKELLDSRCRGKGNDDNNNEDGGDNDDDGEMAVSLNLVICRTHKPLPFETKEEDENHIHCKRRKLDSSSSIQLFLPKSSSSSVVDHHQVQPKVFELSPSSIEEELDLELRLGNKSKV